MNLALQCSGTALQVIKMVPVLYCIRLNGRIPVDHEDVLSKILQNYTLKRTI